MKEYNFSKHSKARKIMIIATCCMAIILSAFSSFSVYSASPFSITDYVNITENVMIEVDNFPYMDENYTYVDWAGSHYYLDDINNAFNNTLNNGGFDNINYDYYSFDNNCYLFVWNLGAKFMLFPEGSFIVGDVNSSDKFVIYYPSDVTYNPLNSLQFGINWNSNLPYQNNNFVYRSGSKTIDGKEYYFVTGSQYESSTDRRILKTDMPCYYAENLDFTSMDDLGSNINTDNSTNLENSSNNLYFKDCDISYSCTGNTNGNIVCQAKLTDYQKEHLDEFLVVYNFTFTVKGYERLYEGTSEGVESSLLGYKYNFSKNYSYQQTLANFYDNSSSKVFTLKDIEQNMNTSDIDSSSVGSYPGSEYQNLYLLFNHWNSNYSSDDLTTYAPFIYQGCTIKTTMFVTLADVNLNNITDNNIRSGSYSESYNFIKGTSSLNSNGILNNTNPVQTNDNGTIDSNEDLAGLTSQGGISGNDMPSSNGTGNGSGSGVVTGDNNIVINNNPTFNNDGGSSSSGGLSQSGGSPSNSGLFSTLVDFVKGDTESTSESVSEMVDSDGWISVINSYYTFIPEKFWTLLFAVLGTCITIMVVAFIISIVLRFIS